jgi:hypothetical protein
MATLLALNDIVEAKFFNRDAAQNGICVLHYKVTAVAGGSLTDQQVCNALSTQAAPLFQAIQSGVTSYVGCRLQKVTPGPVPIAVNSTNGAGAGTGAGSALGAQLAILITKRTDLAGRANRGRTYLPFCSTNMSSAAGNISAAGLAAAAAFAASMFASITVSVGAASVTLQPVIYHRATQTNVPITSLVVRGEFATQRRRSLINRGDQPFA